MYLKREHDLVDRTNSRWWYSVYMYF